MVLISLIIPVYNVEKYLARCLDSCLRQNLNEEEYEIIVVNDGSRDNSLKILNKYADKYPNVILINKLNGGLSSARNAGLKIAKGKLVWFIDSDDWIVENCLRTVCFLFENDDIDMMTFNTYYATDIGCRELEAKRRIAQNEILNGTELYNRGFVYPFTGVPFYVYRCSFLKKNNLYFAEGLYFEDWLFTPISYVYCEKCFYLDKPLYYYYMREGSITQSEPSIKKAEDIIRVAEKLFDEMVFIKRERTIIIYKSVAYLTKAFYTQWYCLNKVDRRYLREKFSEKKFWMKSILFSRQLKYVVVYMALSMNLRLMKLAKYN